MFGIRFLRVSGVHLLLLLQAWLLVLISAKTRLQRDFLCVEWDVTLHSVITKIWKKIYSLRTNMFV